MTSAVLSVSCTVLLYERELLCNMQVAPFLELHHIVILKDPEVKGAYTIDFSPLDYQNPFTLGLMLMGRDMPGEIRVRYIPGASIMHANFFLSPNDF